MGAFFTEEDIETLGQFGNRVLDRVDYMFWINKTEAEPMYLIDSVILGFGNEGVLELVVNEEGDGIELGGKDYEQEQMKLDEEFQGKICYEKIEASQLKAWKEHIGQSLLQIDLLTEDKKKFKNEGLIFRFEAGRIGLSVFNDELKTVALEDEAEEDEM